MPAWEGEAPKLQNLGQEGIRPQRQRPAKALAWRLREERMGQPAATTT